MKINYKNADKNTLKENLKNTIQSLLREGIYDNVDAQGQVSPATQEIDKLASTYDYEQYISLLNQMIQQADAQNMPLRQAIFDAFNNQNGGDIKMSLSNANVPVANLHPTQSEIDLSKSLAFPISKDPASVPQMMNGQTCAPGGKQIITFNGQYVIDGHHRWSQVFCVNPNANISAVNIQCGEIKNPIDMLKATQSAIAAVKVAGGDNTPLPSQVAQKGLNIYELPIQQISAWISQNITDEAVSIFSSSLGYTESAEHSNAQLMYNRMFNKNINEMNEGNVPQTATQNKSKVVQYLSNNCNTLKTEHAPASGAPNRGLMPQTDDYFSEVENALSKGTDDVVVGKVNTQQQATQNVQQSANNYNTEYSSNISVPANNVGNTAQQNQKRQLQNTKGAAYNIQENNNMKLSEKQIKQAVNESIKKVLRETDEINKEYDDMWKAKEYDDFMKQNFLKRGFDTIRGKRPEKPFPYTKNEPMSARAQRYVDAFNNSEGIGGKRIDYDNGESYRSSMGWNKDTYEPVLTQTTYDGSTAAQMRKAFKGNGGYDEWGIEYPYSEFGYTGKYEGDNEDIKRRSGHFDKLVDKVSAGLAKSKKERDSKKKNESVVRLSQDEFSNFLRESVKNAIIMLKEGYCDDRLKNKGDYGNLDETGYHEKQRPDSDAERKEQERIRSQRKKAEEAQKKNKESGSNAIDYYEYKHGKGGFPVMKEE